MLFYVDRNLVDTNLSIIIHALVWSNLCHIQEGEENSKPKKKKKSKQADTDGSKERKKKSKSKTSASGGSKPPLDPLEQFLAGDSDGNDHQSSNYGC